MTLNQIDGEHFSAIAASSNNPPAITMQGSDHLYQWLDSKPISFAFTTCQTNYPGCLFKSIICMNYFKVAALESDSSY
jgi:hypothetical protein